MSQTTLDVFQNAPAALGELLEYATALESARKTRIPADEQRRFAWKVRARSYGLCPNCWLEAHSHPRLNECHIDDVDRHAPPECDMTAHAHAETHLRQ